MPRNMKSGEFKDIVLKFSRDAGKYNWRHQVPKNNVYSGNKSDIKNAESRNSGLLPPGINGSGAFR